MFKLNPNPTFTVKVPLTVAGSEVPAVIDVEFRHKGRTALHAWLKSIVGCAEVDVLAEIMVAWNGPLDDKGEPVAYSKEALAQLIDNYAPAARELLEAYRDALTERREKN